MTPYYLVISYQATWRYIQEDSNHNYRRKASNFVSADKFCIVASIFYHLLESLLLAD